MTISRSLQSAGLVLTCAFLVASTVPGMASEGQMRVEQLLNDHIAQIQYMGKAAKFDWLPGYIIKRDPSRIEGAKAFSECIKKHALKQIIVPEKWLYVLPKKDRAYERDCRVVVKKLEGSHSGLLNLEQAKELWILLQNAKHNDYFYQDAHSDNILFCNDGRIALIDTESEAFMKIKYVYVKKNTPVVALGKLKYIADEQAKKFIDNEFNKAFALADKPTQEYIRFEMAKYDLKNRIFHA